MIKDIFKKLKIVYNDLVVRYFATFTLVIGTSWLLTDAAWTIINIYNYYAGTRLLANSWALFIIVFAIPLIITLFYVFMLFKIRKLSRKLNDEKERSLQDDEIVQFHRNIIDDCFYDIYEQNEGIFEKDIRIAFDNGNWKQVIKIGKYGSRLFLMLANYDLRIKYGEYIIEAANKIGENESAAMGYIDCIGWSYVKKGNYGKAIYNIEKGMTLLEDLKTNESNIMMCKANRHLVWISIMNGDEDAAITHRDAFEKYLKKLKGRDKRIMAGSLFIINGDIEVARRKYENAKKFYLQAHRAFMACNDFERAIKVYYKLGQTNETMNQTPEALKNYLIGFWLADKVSRIDEKYNNCDGICGLILKDSTLLQQVATDKELQDMMKYYEVKWRSDQSFYIDELKSFKKRIRI